MTELIVGSIYQKTSPLRGTPARVTTYRQAVLARANAVLEAAFDDDTERAAKALIEVLDWHKPWQHWRQVFEPRYIGDRYEGHGCRSCGPNAFDDCMTVRAVGDALGVIR